MGFEPCSYEQVQKHTKRKHGQRHHQTKMKGFRPCQSETERICSSNALAEYEAHRAQWHHIDAHGKVEQKPHHHRTKAPQHDRRQWVRWPKAEGLRRWKARSRRNVSKAASRPHRPQGAREEGPTEQLERNWPRRMHRRTTWPAPRSSRRRARNPRVASLLPMHTFGQASTTRGERCPRSTWATLVHVRLLQRCVQPNASGLRLARRLG